MPTCPRTTEGLSTASVLPAPDYNQPFHLYLHASRVGVGAMLLQQNNDTGGLHPTPCYSANMHRPLTFIQLTHSKDKNDALSPRLAGLQPHRQTRERSGQHISRLSALLPYGLSPSLHLQALPTVIFQGGIVINHSYILPSCPST